MTISLFQPETSVIQCRCVWNSIVNCPTCDKDFDTKNALQSHFGYNHSEQHLTVEMFGAETIRDLYSQMSENRVAEELGVSRSAIHRALDHLGVERRGQSEAEQMKWDQMSDEERREQVQAAHEKTREMASDGGHPFQVAWEERPEEMQEQVEEIAKLGAPAREENGMKGVTGQDSPNWRGGKCIYDAVKKQIGSESWDSTKDRVRESACEKCGKTEEECRRAHLDVHHIVPLLCGGTNESWNLMTLCPSCHRESEWYTRNEIGIEPVFVE